MSFHRYIVPPPLAMAIHPAPPPKPKPEKKDDKDGKDKDAKDKDGKDKKDGKKAEAGAVGKKGDEKKDDVKAEDAAEEKKDEESPAENGKDTKAADTKDGKGAVDAKDEKKDDKTDDKDAKEEEAKPLPPLKLLGPAPHRPLRAKLDLNPVIPYPPINTDPRGAYYKYAKAVQAEMIYIDVVKDGWLVEQWRERPEREALARLRGEDQKQKEREVAAVTKARVKRPVPRTSAEILLELWNDLVDAPSNELTTDAFWSRYDWSDPAAEAHLAPAKEAPPPPPPTEEVKEGDKADEALPKAAEDGKKDEKTSHETSKDNEASKDEKKEEKPEEIEEDIPNAVQWTKEGLEVVLATVGVQCSYNTFKPLPRHWAEPAGAYLILGHNYFMLRTEDTLQWKPEESANKFEVLVTSGHDRVFGDMVKAQQMEERKKKEKEYRERKLAEKKKAAAEAKARGETGEKEKDGKDRKVGKAGDDKADKPKGDTAKDGKDKDLKVDVKAEAKDNSPVSPASSGSNVKVKNGEEIKPHKEEAKEADAERVVVAVPVKEAKDKDAKHDGEVVAAAPGEAKEAAKEAAKDGKDGKDKAGRDEKAKDAKAKAGEKPKEKKPYDPMREAEMLAKMIQASGGGPEGPVGMEEIKMAFKALEMAAEKNAAKDGGVKKDVGPLIWTWHDSCERWRWKNYEAGLHLIGPGGWEERDWRVFADDRGCDEYDSDEAWAEEEEEDVHDWSC